jgi:2'-5' RNA ligase
MTKLALVAYPALTDPDHRWIEGIRVQHDPQAHLIRAHFTLVFPAEIDPEVVIAHASVVCGDTRPILFAIKQAEAVRDAPEAGGHVFLVPEAGYSEIGALHDRLYEGVLRAHLREGARFVPHITVAAYPDFERCLVLAQELNLVRPNIEVTIDRVEVVAVSPDQVQSLATVALGGISEPEEDRRTTRCSSRNAVSKIHALRG